MQLILDAVIKAVKAHKGQKRLDSDEDYVLHPLRVARLIEWDFPGCDAMIAAAILHDVLEDSTEQIDEFPTAVIDMVKNLTKLPHETKNEAIKKLEGRGIWIKAADRLDNYQSGGRFATRYRQNEFERTGKILEKIQKECSNPEGSNIYLELFEQWKGDAK